MTNSGMLANDCALLRISGADHHRFLQDLITNDLKGLEAGAIYAALLTPQGKYLFDFFVLQDGDSVLIDVKADRAQALSQRLAMYKLRAKVVIEASDLQVVQVFGAKPEAEMTFADPRNAELGWRVYSATPDAVLAGLEPATGADWTALRIKHLVPETGVELKPEDAYILEQGFERLNGVDFKKGCYVGQEVTARMKHKTELRKGLARVLISGEAPAVGTPIESEGKAVGELLSNANGQGLAYLRFDRAKGELRAGGALVQLAAD